MASRDGLILCFGEILWDSLPAGLFPGGAPVNVAYHLARLGLHPLPVTAVGRDFLGDELLRRMERRGLETACVTRNNHATGAVLVELDGAGIPQFNILENAAWDEIKLNDAARNSAPQAQAIIYGTLAQRCAPNRERLAELFHLAPKALRIFDVNLRPPADDPEVIRSLAARAQVIKLNHDELHRLTGGAFGAGDCEPPARAFSRVTGCDTICVTAGPRGAGLLVDDAWHWVDARPVQVRDTVGSGDSFLASLTRSLLSGRVTPRCMLEHACRLAEFVATQDGAMPAYIVNDEGSILPG